MRSAIGFWIGLSVVGVVLAGCGNPAPASAPAAPAPASGDTMSSMPAPSSSADGASAPVAGNAVNIAQFAFSPASLTVKVGTTVTWTNNDGEPHTVTSTNNDGPLKSPAMKTGDTYTFTFTTAGTFNYLCTIHPFMTATVVVTA